MEAMKTMVHDQDLPMHLWVEASRTVVYVQNRLSHSALGFKTLEEMYTGKRTERIHLKIFGFLVYVHIPKEKRTKLDHTIEKWIRFPKKHNKHVSYVCIIDYLIVLLDSRPLKRCI